jgi:hypothetical protein
MAGIKLHIPPLGTVNRKTESPAASRRATGDATWSITLVHARHAPRCELYFGAFGFPGSLACELAEGVTKKKKRKTKKTRTPKVHAER